MKMGVKEFRERFSEVAVGEEPVMVTKNGQVIGRYLPEHRPLMRPSDLAGWVAELENSRDRWRAATPDWRERSLAVGLLPEDLDD